MHFTTDEETFRRVRPTWAECCAVFKSLGILVDANDEQPLRNSVRVSSETKAKIYALATARHVSPAKLVLLAIDLLERNGRHSNVGKANVMKGKKYSADVEAANLENGR